jgi:hypothetical protein
MQPVGIIRGTWKGRLGPHPVPERGGKMFLRIIRTNLLKLKLNSMALVRERTIPTERPPPVGEVSANFCG